MVNKLVVGVLILLLILPVAIAATEINIKTLPNHKMNIFVQRATPPLSILDDGSFLGVESGSTGETSISFLGPENEARINIKVTKNGKEIIHEIFEDMPLGSPLYLQVIPGDVSDNYNELDAICDPEKLDECEDETGCEEAEGFWYGDSCNEEECDSDNLDLCASELTCGAASGFWYDETCNVEAMAEGAEDPAEEVSVEEGEEGANSGITGFSIGEDLKSSIFSSKTFWIVIVSLIGIAILALITKHKIGVPAKFKPGKIFSSRSEIEQELSRAERKIEEAQREIKRIKSKDKIDAARKRIEKEQEELRKLERGEAED